jgi:hypothetical protein
MPHVSKLSPLHRAGHQSGQTAARVTEGASPQIIFAKKEFCKKPYPSDEKNKGEHNDRKQKMPV